MNYLQWNNAIIKHFFNPENELKEVMLYFSEEIIEEIGINNFPIPEEGYVEDFYKALRVGVVGIPNDNYIDRMLRLEERYRNGCRKIDGVEFEYPPNLAYLLAFILSFTIATPINKVVTKSGTGDNEYNANNFHKPVKYFFESVKLTTNYDRIIKEHLGDIDGLWQELINWLVEKNYWRFGYIEKINPHGNRCYVGKFEYHILFKKEQEELLSAVFDKNNILPGDPINEKVMRKLLVDNYKYLKLSQKTKNNIADISDHIGGKILKRALLYYKNWDGINYAIIEGKRGFTRNKLVLCLDFNTVSQIINLKYFRIFSKNGVLENLKLEKKGGEILDCEIYQINSFYSNPIEKCFKDLVTDFQLTDTATRSRYTWKKKDFYLFKKNTSLFDWVEIPKIEYNVRLTLIICKINFYETELKEWFENIPDNKKLYENNSKTQLPNGWLAFTIETITKYPHPIIQELIPEPDQNPKIDFDKSFYIDGKLFKNKLPNVWAENFEIIDIIVAKYEDGSIIPLSQHTLEENGITQLLNLFSFTEEHISSDKLNRQFKLVCGEVSIHRFLQIEDFIKKNNSEIEALLPKRDVFGQLTLADQDYFKGIEHFFNEDKIRKLIPYQAQLEDIFINRITNEDHRENDNYDSQHIGNLLIQYISTKGRLSKEEFNKIVFSLLEKSVNRNFDIKKEAVKLSFLLQDLGYLEYDSSKSCFTINKPHLVVIPTEKGTKFNLVGARDKKLINDIINFQKQNPYFKIEITNNVDGEYKLLPQNIHLYLRKCDQSLIVPLVKKFDIIFKKGNLFTQYALTAAFPDIDKWETYIFKTDENATQDADGGWLFDLETLAFIIKPENFDKTLAFVKIKSYITFYRLWYQGICYTIPDHKSGIYLYIYLYRKIKTDIYNQAVAEKGWSNCGKELEERAIAALKTNILVYDRERKLLAVPFYCGLPRYFSTSFQLLSTQPSVRKKLKFEGVRYDGTYHIYQNIPNKFFCNTFINLLLKRDQLSPIHAKSIIL